MNPSINIFWQLKSTPPTLFKTTYWHLYHVHYFSIHLYSFTCPWTQLIDIIIIHCFCTPTLIQQQQFLSIWWTLPLSPSLITVTILYAPLPLHPPHTPPQSSHTPPHTTLSMRSLNRGLSGITVTVRNSFGDSRAPLACAAAVSWSVRLLISIRMSECNTRRPLRVVWNLRESDKEQKERDELINTLSHSFSFC